MDKTTSRYSPYDFFILACPMFTLPELGCAIFEATEKTFFVIEGWEERVRDWGEQLEDAYDDLVEKFGEDSTLTFVRSDLVLAGRISFKAPQTVEPEGVTINGFEYWVLKGMPQTGLPADSTEG